MDSVAVDLFSMTEVEFEGEIYDTIFLCVCRASGYILAEPCRDKWLTAEKVGKMMYRKWEDFGIPTVVTADGGQHFAYSWWQTLCAEFGVKAAWCQPYHHQGNGAAEVAGQKVRDVIKRMVTDLEEPAANWIEVLPEALRLLRDLPHPLTGISPYEYVFGRQRGLAGLPYKPCMQALDAKKWLEHQRILTEKLVDRVNDEHKRRVEHINKTRKDVPPLKVGDTVWYRGPGKDKLSEYWTGPGKITAKEGEHSYEVEIAPGDLQKCHRGQLMPHVDDTYATKLFPKHYFSGKAPWWNQLSK